MDRRAVLAFGVLSRRGDLLLAHVVNVLTAALALAGFYFYVFIYTRWLKRRTPQNIVIGGAAGAFPPLVGWAAVTGHVDLAAVAAVDACGHRRARLDAGSADVTAPACASAEAATGTAAEVPAATAAGSDRICIRAPYVSGVMAPVQTAFLAMRA